MTFCNVYKLCLGNTASISLILNNILASNSKIPLRAVVVILIPDCNEEIFNVRRLIQIRAVCLPNFCV